MKGAAMTSKTTGTDVLTRATSAIPSCSIDEAGLEDQRARHSRLSPSVVRLVRTDEAIEVDFDEDFDREALQSLIAVERECCPFFEFDFDPAERRLRVTVRETEQAPALDALAAALGATRQDPSIG
jgi:hypothetical protein